MADASDSNSLGKPCGFNSHLRHLDLERKPGLPGFCV